MATMNTVEYCRITPFEICQLLIIKTKIYNQTDKLEDERKTYIDSINELIIHLPESEIIKLFVKQMNKNRLYRNYLLLHVIRINYKSYDSLVDNSSIPAVVQTTSSIPVVVQTTSSIPVVVQTTSSISVVVQTTSSISDALSERNSRFVFNKSEGKVLIQLNSEWNLELLKSSRKGLITWGRHYTESNRKQYNQESLPASENQHFILGLIGLYNGCTLKLSGNNIIVSNTNRTYNQNMLLSTFSNPILFEKNIKHEISTHVHIFIDISNIMGSAQYDVNGNHNPNIRLNFEKLHELVLGIRNPKTLVLRGSTVNDNQALVKGWEYLGYNVQVEKRNGGNEHFVDSALVSEIQRILLRKQNKEQEELMMSGELSKKIILLSGDGNLNKGESNFRDAIFAALDKNWDVEIWCWERSCSIIYQNLARGKVKGRTLTKEQLSKFKLVYLDNYRESITFIKS